MKALFCFALVFAVYFSFASADSSLQCQLCQFVVGEVDTSLANNQTQAAIVKQIVRYLEGFFWAQFQGSAITAYSKLMPKYANRSWTSV